MNARPLIPYAGRDPDEDWPERKLHQPLQMVRAKSATLSLTSSDRAFVDDEARRRGTTVCRLLGDLVEVAIARGLFDKLLGKP